MRAEIGAGRDGARIAVDGDHLAVRRRQQRARIAAGAEGAVDIHAAVLDLKEIERRAAEHGNVGGWSASDSGKAVAARRHSRAPRALRAAAWELSSLLERAHLLGGLRELALKPAGLPDLKLVAEADESDRLARSPHAA